MLMGFRPNPKRQPLSGVSTMTLVCVKSCAKEALKTGAFSSDSSSSASQFPNRTSARSGRPGCLEKLTLFIGRAPLSNACKLVRGLVTWGVNVNLETSDGQHLVGTICLEESASVGRDNSR